MYLKIPMNKGDLAFGYIAQKDERGNSNIINMKKKKLINQILKYSFQ